MQPIFSVVLPAKNEAATLGPLVKSLKTMWPGCEVIVVDDGSSDATSQIARDNGARVVRHPVSRGNGAAVKTGARQASHPTTVFMDADGQHDPAEIPLLLARLDQGFDMAVGARVRSMHAGFMRWLANRVYNTLASWITGTQILDLTSGFRAARTELFREFLPLLPNGFSYPTTITMAFMRAGYGVCFEPAQVRVRSADSQSHIRPLRDGGRFFLIIFRVGTLYSPLKVFVPVSVLFFLGGAVYYSYTLSVYGRFTNFGALLFVTSVVIFLIGLVSEQITALMYRE